MNERLVNPDQQPVDRVFRFGSNLAANEQDHQDWDKGHAEKRSKEHREGLRIRQRTEQPPFLCLERKDRDEADGDDEERKEERAADLFGGGDDHVEA